MNELRILVSLAVVFLLAGTGVGCDGERAAKARARILNDHAPRVGAIVREDFVKHARGLQAGAARIAAGFVRVQGEQQQHEMRAVLRLLRNPKRGVPELVISPMSFLAVVDANGVVIARDGEDKDDRMKGMQLAAKFPSVKQALAGEAASEVGAFESFEKGGEPSVSIVMAAPAHYGGKVVGALVLGVPLWRLQQRLSKQLQMEGVSKDPGSVLWVYVYQGDKLHKHGTPPDLDTVVPDGAARRAGLAKSPGGFTGELKQFGFWYGYGVKPLRMLGDDIGVVLFRMDPQ